jgi:4'-phosphopantetheinyl transferase
MPLVHVLHTLNDQPLETVRLELLTRRLPSQMQSHLRRFRKWQDYQASLFGKLLLHDGLVNLFGMDAQVLGQVMLTEGLKPELPGSNIFFSIAHSGVMVVCAIGQMPLGIDVEKVREMDKGALQEHLPALTGTSGTDQGFFEQWTAAEAVLKASGDGLRHSMNEITIDPEQWRATFKGHTWHLTPLSLHDGYRCCLATARRAVVVTEFQPPLMVASLTQREEKGLEQESLYGL